jgi:hypothetical protein
MKPPEALIGGHTSAKRGSSGLYARGAIAMLMVSVVLATISSYGCHIFLTANGVSMPLVPSASSIAYGLTKWLWWGLVAFGMWVVAQKAPGFLKFSPLSTSLQLLIGSVVCFAHLLVVQATWRGGLHWNQWVLTHPITDYITLSSFGEDLIIYGFLFGFSGFLHLQEQRQMDALLKLELEKQLSEAQLKALQMQMEPHFLFNTLNAVNSLVDLGRNKEASEALGHLDTILRSTLRYSTPAKIPFVEELRTVESYLAIQKVRFAHRLQIKVEATPEALEGLVPCFLLQPLVENAIHHGIAPVGRGGTVETSVKRIGDRLWMQVRDNGAGPGHANNGHGIGIRNTRERLAYFYPKMHEFTAIAPEAGGYEVTIEIPFEKATQ